jgi:hypothetical protein
MERDESQVASYNVFAVSNDDLVRIRDLYASFFRQMRAIIAQSEPVEQVVLTNFQLIPLGGMDATKKPGRRSASGAGDKRPKSGA